MSTVAEPNFYIVKLYYYYSSCTLIISWSLAPILFYIILTQSKNLGNFKWFIFNHSIWCLIHETFFAIVKPLILVPAAAGFQIGFFRNILGLQSSIIFAAIHLGLSCNCIVGVCATVGSRYMLIFPSFINHWFSLRIAAALAVAIHLLCYSLIAYVFLPLFSWDEEAMHQIWGKEYDFGLQNYFTESTFFAIPHSYHDLADSLTLAFFAITHICGGAVFASFVYQILTKKSSKILTNNVQRSLIISCLFQMGLTSAFLFSPVIFFFLAIRFDIPNSSTFMTFLLCISSTHCLIEFVVTLYFISPYRSFIARYFRDPQISSDANASLFTPSTIS